MKILILSEAENPHTLKWVSGIKSRDIEVAVWSLSTVKNEFYKKNNIPVYGIGIADNLTGKESGSFGKLVYLTAVSKLKKLINEFQPDILHAHFASSYGLIGALTGFHPFIISVWGKDIYDFPLKSPLHKFIIKYNLAKADKVLSTSEVMKEVTSLYTGKSITVTPFGTDVEKFAPIEKTDSGTITIGSIKALNLKYGQDILLMAFASLVQKHKYENIRLLIVGGGPEEKRYKELAESLEISDKTEFAGKIDYFQIPEYHGKMDIEVYPSRFDSESFGVSIVEAQSCGIPVVVSNVGGLPEVVDNNKTGIVVPKEDMEAVTLELKKLIDDPALRKSMGEAGRKRVFEKYNFEKNLSDMINIYREVTD
ncbi:MAG: capsular polysaccharide biosynthesis protein [Melioribacteraceae bacterium]|nr:MAG: capsular polysaccharide biosynthesis protein [Melioribacteraceae bacterium]